MAPSSSSHSIPYSVVITTNDSQKKKTKKTKEKTKNLPSSKDELVRLLQLIPHPEGGYFRETWRSGVLPMQSRGQTDLNVTRPRHDLVLTHRQNRLTDDGRRNALTSIFWVPTLQSPKLLLAVNESDHVHYYQGGLPFEYFLYTPSDAANPDDSITLSSASSSSSSSTGLTRVVLGPNLYEGHQLQVPVTGGTWKCGRILQQNYSNTTLSYADDDDDEEFARDENHDDDDDDDDKAEYTIIGEAVAPGFDFYDFAWITLEQIEQQSPTLDAAARKLLGEFCHPMNQNVTLNEIDAHYDATDGDKNRSPP